MSPYQYRKSHCGNKAIAKSSYLQNGASYTGMLTSLYWINIESGPWDTKDARRCRSCSRSRSLCRSVKRSARSSYCERSTRPDRDRDWSFFYVDFTWHRSQIGLTHRLLSAIILCFCLLPGDEVSGHIEVMIANRTGPRLNIKTVLSTYGDFHVKDKTAVRTSYL